MSDRSALEIHPLTTDRWDDLVKLFGETGGDGGCWCMYWRLSQKDYSLRDRSRRRRDLKSLVENGNPVGLLAYHGKIPVGWCGLGPRKSFERLERSRYLKRVDDQPVWSIVCFFINSKYRRKGIASTIIKTAIEYATTQGAAALESYPILEWGTKVTPSSAYTGTVEMFQKAGFQKVKVTQARCGGQPRVIMRYDLTRE